MPPTSNSKRLLAFLAVPVILIGVYLAAHHSSRNFLDPSKAPPAPLFTLADLDKQPVSLATFRGKVVLLNFWATWCGPCTKETPRFIEFQSRYGSQGLQILGISLDDDAAPVRKFRDEFRVNYPLAVGDAKLAESYGGVLGLPITFLIDRQGRIVAKHVGAVDLNKLEQEIRILVEQERS